MNSVFSVLQLANRRKCAQLQMDKTQYSYRVGDQPEPRRCLLLQITVYEEICSTL